MSKVTNSVQQILTCCDEMIKYTEDCEYVDVKILASQLKEKCNELKELFDTSPEKEHDIAYLKARVEECALRLEFYVDKYFGAYTDRRKMRKFADTMYSDLTNICNTIILTKSEEDSKTILTWSERMRWALSFMGRAQHILFEVDDEDSEKIKEITNAIKAFKEDNK